MRDWEIDPEFVLKVTPHKAPKGMAYRDRLRVDLAASTRSPLFFVEAPPGFGKTLLLTQWRRDHINQGGLAAWISIDDRDAALRFPYGLACAMHVATARKNFGQKFMHWLGGQTHVDKALTGWLAEIAESPVDTVIMLDLAERFPDDLGESLTYLARNAPPNLKIVIATRPIPSNTALAELVRLAAVRIGASELAFSLDETVSVLKAQLAQGFDPERGARFHALTEGWPLGLQLAASILRRYPEFVGSVDSGSDIQRYFMDTLVSRLTPDAFDLIVRLSAFDYIHTELCDIVTGSESAHHLLDQLRRDTPVIIEVEGSSWYRMHPLARDFLRPHFLMLPDDQRLEISRQGSEWLAEHGLYEEAANHAFQAGELQLAYGFVELALREMFGKGQVSLVMEWVDRMPAQEFEGRPALQLTAAWGLACSFRCAEAEAIVERLTKSTALDDKQRFEADMVVGASSSFSDHLEKCVVIVEHWPEPPKGADPQVSRAYLNHLALVELHRGHPEKARHHLMHVLSMAGTDLSFAFCDLNVAMSYLWEGQMALATQVARPALAKIERQMGRRSPIACMIAVILARALWEQNQGDEARVVMAHRLDVLEQTGLPLTILLGYITLARFAEDDGNEGKVLSLLDGLYTLGEARQLPRLAIAALCEQVRFHAIRWRTETARSVTQNLDRTVANAQALHAGIFNDWLTLYVQRAYAYRAVTEMDWKAVNDHGFLAGTSADRLRRLNDLCEIRLLRAFAIDRAGGDGAPLYREVVSIATASGLIQVLRKTHPEILSILRQRFNYESPSATKIAGADERIPPTGKTGFTTAPRSAILTSKELEILSLIACGISNKEIATSLLIGEETVKWHIKNLFRKLDVGTRRQAVNRANMLGIIDLNDRGIRI